MQILGIDGGTRFLRIFTLCGEWKIDGSTQGVSTPLQPTLKVWERHRLGRGDQSQLDICESSSLGLILISDLMKSTSACQRALATAGQFSRSP